MKNSLPQPDAPLPKGLLQHLPNGSAQSSGEVAAVAETKKKQKKKQKVTAWRGLRQGTKRLLAQLGPVTCANSAVSLIFCARDCGGRAEHASSIHGRMRFDSVRMCFVTAGCVRCSTSGMTAPSRLWYSRESRTCQSSKGEKRKGKNNLRSEIKGRSAFSSNGEKRLLLFAPPTDRHRQTHKRTCAYLRPSCVSSRRANCDAPLLHVCARNGPTCRGVASRGERERESEREVERERVCVCATHVHIQTRKYKHAHIHTRKHTHTHTHKHTNTHTHTHTHKHSQPSQHEYEHILDRSLALQSVAKSPSPVGRKQSIKSQRYKPRPPPPRCQVLSC